MNISRSNYEIWFIDHADGKLTAAQEKQLMCFLEDHPDLKEEFELFLADDLSLADVNVEMPGKEMLKKHLISSEQLIAYFENDLSQKDRSAVESALKNNKSLAAEYSVLEPAEVIHCIQLDTVASYSN